MLVYFDTSAANYVIDQLSIDDAISTKAFQEVRGRKWCLSPVALWEIMNTSDADRRERLIFFSQHLFSEDLLPSPEELLVSYIEQGCPRNERRRDLRSTADIASVWKGICQDTRKTLIFDHDEIRSRFKMLIPVTRDVHRITRNRSIRLDRYTHEEYLDTSLDQLVRNLSWVKGKKNIDDRTYKIHKLAIFYILFFLCAEVGVHPEPIRRFWARLGINDTLERIRYIMSEHEVLAARGPIAVMALMTYVQTNGKFSRGVYWDSLHSVYLTYVDWLFSEDPHFKDLRDEFSDHPYWFRIHIPSECQWVTHERPGPLVPGVA